VQASTNVVREEVRLSRNGTASAVSNVASAIAVNATKITRTAASKITSPGVRNSSHRARRPGNHDARIKRSTTVVSVTNLNQSETSAARKLTGAELIPDL
jgi:hypothetical protein